MGSGFTTMLLSRSIIMLGMSSLPSLRRGLLELSNAPLLTYRFLTERRTKWQERYGEESMLIESLGMNGGEAQLQSVVCIIGIYAWIYIVTLLHLA